MNGNNKKQKMNDTQQQNRRYLKVFHVALYLKKQNKLNAAKVCFETTMDMYHPTACCHFHIAEILIIQNKKEEALKHIRIATSIQPLITQYKQIEKMLCNQIAKFGHISFNQKI